MSYSLVYDVGISKAVDDNTSYTKTDTFYRRTISTKLASKALTESCHFDNTAGKAELLFQL